MKKQLLYRVLLLLIIVNGFGCSQSPSYDLAIENVSVFNSKDKTVSKNRTVLISGDTIAAILANTDVYKAKETIDGEERLLTPGFIDTHTHLIGNYGADADNPETYLEDSGIQMLRELSAHHYMAHGVTTIIDMGQPETWMEHTLAWQKNPAPEYPTVFICGGSMVSDEDRWQPAHHIEVKNPEDARKKVREYAEMGLKYMKLYRKLQKPDYEAMVDEADKQGILINTHVDNNVVTIQEAMDYGVRNFEHFFTVTPSILSYDTHWPLMNKAYDIRMNASIDEFTAHMVFFFKYIKENPEFDTKLRALFDDMAEREANLSTALNVLASAAQKTDFFTSFEYYPMRKKPNLNYSATQQQALNEAYQAMMSYIKLAHEKGVKLRIGTDCRFGGRSLLSEMMLLFQAGIPMNEVLQIATLNGYESMRLDKHRGSIEIGKKADLVLFDKNPFDDYNNILSDKTIIKDGRVFHLKKSLGHELKEVLAFEGVKAGMNWFEENKTNPDFGPMVRSELKNTVKELIGGGKPDEAIAAHGLYSKLFPESKININGTVITNTMYAMLREGKEAKAKHFYHFASQNFPNTEKFMGLHLLITMMEKDIPSVEREFDQQRSNALYTLDENELNGVGYLLLQQEKLEEAITIFKINVRAFPDSWNTYDSLGEAYLTAGDKSMAIKNYRESVRLNPENKYGIEALKKLGVE